MTDAAVTTETSAHERADGPPPVRFIEIPHSDVTGVFVAGDEEGFRLSDDPRELARPGMTLDPAAICSVLRFGALIPPLSPWREIRRLLPGYRYRLRAGGPPERLDPLPFDVSVPLPGRRLEEQADALSDLLDRQLADLTGRPAVLFSGGVDSGLIAARLAAVGRRDALLINYAFGREDPESALAEAMAARLGLEFRRVLHDPSEQTHPLERPGATYPLPFGDHSTAPTSALARRVIERFRGESLTLLDGTGADGGFGMSGKFLSWQRLTRIPRPARSLAGAMYRFGYWARTGPAERRLRILRRSATMPVLSAPLAQNPLAGILYDGCQAARIDELLADWIGGWPADGDAGRVVAADLAVTCANVFAQKARPIFSAAAIDVRYPFLSPEIAAFAVRTAKDQPPDRPKAALKLALGRAVPPEMILRPKSGFVDPSTAVFRDPRFLAFLAGAAEPSAPLAEFVSRKRLTRAADLLRSGRELPPQTLNCLWAIVFLDRWLRTAAPDASEEPRASQPSPAPAAS